MMCSIYITHSTESGAEKKGLLPVYHDSVCFESIILPALQIIAAQFAD